MKCNVQNIILVILLYGYEKNKFILLQACCLFRFAARGNDSTLISTTFFNEQFKAGRKRS